MRDRRISLRTRTLRGAQIIWDNGSAVKCTVRNVSKNGAKLEAHGLVVKKNGIEYLLERIRVALFALTERTSTKTRQRDRTKDFSPGHAGTFLFQQPRAG